MANYTCSYLNYSSKKKMVYNGIYVYEISNGFETLTTPHIHSGNEDDEDIQKILFNLNNMEYYADNAKDSFESLIGSYLLGKICSYFKVKGDVNAVVSVSTAINTKKPTKEKVIDFLKSVVGFVSSGGGAGDLAVAIYGHQGCMASFDNLKKLI